MKILLTITAIFAGAYLSAQSQYPEYYRGDTTFYLLPDYFDQFEFLEGTESMDIGHIGKRVYTFMVKRETQMVYAVPITEQWPAVAMTYPRSHHTHKHEAYTKAQDYRDLQEWVYENRGRRNVIWK